MTTRSRERGGYISNVITGTANIRENQHSPTHTCKSRSESRSTTYPYPQGEVESMTDVVIPGFAKKVANGSVFNNPMSSFKGSRSVEVGTCSISFAYKATDDPAHRHCSDFYWESVSNAPICLNGLGTPVQHLYMDAATRSMIEEAGTEAYAAIDSPTVDGTVFIAELRETISYLKNPLREFCNLATKARSQKRRAEARRLNRRKNPFGRRKGLTNSEVGQTTEQYLRDQWLSWRYGFRPIVKDIEDAAVAVAQIVLNEKPIRKTARGFSSTSTSRSASGSAPLDSRVEWEQDTSSRINVRAGVLYEFERDPQTLGLEITRAPLGMWEAIPFSFVVDRFLNVGSFVEAITPKAGIRHLAAWTTVINETESTRTSRVASQGDVSGRVGTVLSDGQTVEKYSTISKIRTPGVKIGLTRKSSPLGNKDDWDVSFITDLVALGSQILRSK